MKFSALRVVAPALFAAFAALPAAAQSYDITNISLPGATQWAIAGINANGQVAGTTAVGGQFRAFFVTHTDGTIDIGTLGGARASAYAISGSGQIVGSSDVAQCCFTRHAFSWTKDGGMVDVGTLGGSVSDAVAVNDSGMVAGHSLTSNAVWHAFSWTKSGGVVELGSLGGHSQAYAINASGQIVGTSNDANGVTHAVLWNPGSTIKDLGLLPGFNYGRAMFINDAGQVTGYALVKDANGADGAQHAFFYTDAAGLVDLGTLGGSRAWPVKMNASGRVIGASLTGTNSYFDQHAFTWTPSEGLTDLTLGGGWSNVFDISSTGQVVGFTGTAAGANQHAFSWTKSGGMIDLGTFGGTYSVAYGVNKWGQVVGQSALPGDDNSHAFLYDGTSVKDLNDLAPRKPSGMEILNAGFLSDSKSMIAGTNVGFVLLSPEAVATSPPAVGQITANDPVAVGAVLSVSANFTDAATDTHTATFAFGDGTPQQAGTVSEANGSGTASGSHTFSVAGIYPVTLAVTDSTGLTATVTRDVVVYDAAYGFVTGQGWFQSPPGAYKPDVAAVGRAMFTFVSKYQKGAKTPIGTTDFRFQTANLDFHSDTHDWLVVGGARAQFKGAGSLNDVAGYQFMLTAIDGDISGGGGTDRFRIKISRYDETLKQDVVVYDNQISSGTEGTLSEGTALGAGNIVIHTAKN